MLRAADARSLACGALDDLAAVRRQGGAPAFVAHWPYPLPQRPWVMAQSWLDVLFSHWRVDAEQVARNLPGSLRPDLIDGSAWVGIVAFAVRTARPRLMPPVPFFSAFPQVNVRTYVTVGAEPGAYFLSLDAGNGLAAAVARRAYRLPYFRARATLERRGDGAVAVRSEREPPRGEAARFAARYAAAGEPFTADAGSLEWSLTERYCAYSVDDRGRLLRAEIHHRPWGLHLADANIAENTMAAPLGIELTGEPLLHFATRQDAVLWPPEVAAAAPNHLRRRHGQRAT
jgi:uncharacterized protein YqjF (DUF2071 family)